MDNNSSKKLIVTTSWDDGHRLDIKLSQLLTKYGLTGTFYISKEYLGAERLAEEEIQIISKSHEIGSHCIGHPKLPEISPEDARIELRESKQWLERVVGQNVDSFCYPYGIFNAPIKELVKAEGYSCARTIKRFETSKPQDAFEMGITMHVYPFPFRKISSKKYYPRYLLSPYLLNRAGIRKLGIPFLDLFNWLSFAKAVFDKCLEKGEVFHLYGHSWEIEKYAMWGELEELFKYISKRADCTYCANSELIEK